jgi:sodium transport system ATP-binding protein
MIEVHRLSKSFLLPRKTKKTEDHDPREQGRFFHALKDVSFNARGGQIMGLLGLNGAGKTTLLRVLSTSLKPSSGMARIDGINVCADPTAVRRKIGFLSGNDGLYGRLTATEVVSFYGRMHGISKDEVSCRVRRLFEDLEITPFAHKHCHTLSTGLKQKVSIARSLVHEPEIIIFDEPTTGLDVAATQHILNFIENCKREGKSIIFSTHHMHEAERLCDRVMVIHQGEQCFEGTVEKMKKATGRHHLDEAFLDLIGKVSEPDPGQPEAEVCYVG